MKKAISRLNWQEIVFLAGALMIAMAVITGCARKKQVILVSDPPEAREAILSQIENTKKFPTREPNVYANPWHVVLRHETLWSIAGSDMGDSFLWPLVYRANRDEIEDPDLIYSGQNFEIPMGASLKQAEIAKQKAMERPKYVPHLTPESWGY